MFPKLATLVALTCPCLALALAGDDPKPTPPPVAAAPAKPAARKAGFLQLFDSLKDSPGCLGIETAKTGSGKQVIFAWYKDKASALAWVNGDYHSEMMALFGGPPGHPAMEHVADDEPGPILVVASITPSLTQKIEGFPLPIAQLSVELYKALPGGAAVNGTFAPKAAQVPKLRDYTPKGDAKK